MRIHALGNDDAPTSFPRSVSASEFKRYSETNEKEHKRIDLALWGDEGTTGIVKTVNDMAMQQKILIASIIFVQPLLFAVILKWLGV